MDLEMLKLALIAKGIPAEAIDLAINQGVEFLAHLDDFFESGADAHRAQEAQALLAAAESAHRLGQTALAAAFIEHAEWLVNNGPGGDEDEAEEKPAEGVPTGPTA